MKHLLPIIFLAFALLLPVAPTTHAQTPIQPANPDELKVIEPKLQVDIPGLDFKGSVIVTGDDPVGDCETNMVCVNVIGDYLNAVFRYGLGAGIIFTIVLMMVGGVEWMMGSAVGSIAKGKQRVKNAALGMLLLLGTTVFLTFLNPAITALNTIRISTIKKAPPFSVETLTNNSSVTTDIQNSKGEVVNAASVRLVKDPSAGGRTISHPNIKTRAGSGTEMVHADMVAPIHRAANALNKATGGKYGIEVIAGFSDPADSIRKFYESCVKDGATCKELLCNPLPDNSNLIEGDYEEGFRLTEQALELKETNNWNDPQLVDYMSVVSSSTGRRSCPYETGYAVGVVCEGQDERAITDLGCQVQLEQAMKDQGMCRSYFSPWHYEEQNHKTSTGDCYWKVGTMLVPLEFCTNPSADDVEYTDGGEGSGCAVNYADQVDTCARFDLRTGTCTRSQSEEDQSELDYF